MMRSIFFVTLLFTQSAFATIWITLSDPQSKKIGVIGASSGEIGNYRTMVPVENEGIAVVGSWYLNRKNKHLKKLISNRDLSARDVVEQFSKLINQDSHKRRVSFVNSRFENASQPGRGCHNENHWCGKYEDPKFTITGGGLVSENVILAAKDVLLDRSIEDLPIECQLYKGMEAIFKAGGEWKLINRLSIMVDDVTKKKDLYTKLFFRKNAHENILLDQLKTYLKQKNINCQ